MAASNIRHRMPRPRHRELRGTNYTIFEHRRTERPGRRARADPRGDSEPNPIARTIPITKVAVAGGDGAVRARSPVYPHVRQLTYEPYNARGRGVTDGVLLLEPISANRTRMALISYISVERVKNKGHVAAGVGPATRVTRSRREAARRGRGAARPRVHAHAPHAAAPRSMAPHPPRARAERTPIFPRLLSA